VGECVLKRGFLLAMVLSLAACGGVDPDSPLGKRTAIFKQMLNVSEDLGGMLRGRIAYDEQLFVEKAMELDTLSQQPWQHFPTVKDDDKTSARDDVWERQERFQELARVLEGTTARLVASTTELPLNQSVLSVRVQAVEDACESCHQEFRAY
jgi:cytochrome c556